ncbi:MAG: hypothetical protein ABI400_08740 [Lacisediminihabitans sp.]
MTNEGAVQHGSQDSHDQLQAAAFGGSRGSDISRSARRLSAFFTAILGVSVALFLLAVVYVYPTHSLWLIIAVTVLYGAGIASACIWFQRARRASSRGWARRYGVGFALTMALYAAGVAFTVSTDWRTAWFWLPYAIITATPVVVAGMMRGSAR